MDRDKYLLTGEVARMMNTTKNTLFHYDQIGLFSPEYVDEQNEYRYYSVYQLEALDVIFTLKELGMPLAEIKEYMDHRSSKAYEQLLMMEQELIEKQIQSLRQRRQRITEQQRHMRELERINTGKVECRRLPVRYYAAKPVRRATDREMTRQLGELMRLYKEAENEQSYSVAYVQTKEYLTQNIYDHYCEVGAFFTEKPERMQVQRIEEGDYVCAYHKGHWNTIGQTYQRMYEYIRKEGLEIEGRFYEEYMIDARMTNSFEEYLTRITCRIR